MVGPRQPEVEEDREDERLRLQDQLAHERRVREEAEALLASKSRELSQANQRLVDLAESLERQIGFKTLELLNAQRLARFGTLVWDIRAERITWSEGVYHILGLDPDGEPLSFERYISCVHPDDRRAVLDHIQQSINDTLEPHYEYRVEHRIVTPSGEIRWLRGYGEAIFQSGGEIEYAIGAVRDVTADKISAAEAEESRRIIEARLRELEDARDELAKARDAAQAASRAKSRFLAMMSHEIRTPMNGILGTLRMLEETPLEAAQKRLVETALGSGENLRAILDDILDLSKMEAGRLTLDEVTFDLSAAVEEACRFWHLFAQQKHLAFHVRINEGIPALVRGDGARIRQILNNLVANAIKFTTHGEVSVGLGVDSKTQSGDGGRTAVVLEVRDTGIGIPRDQQHLLFREFSQIGRPGVPGTGLGLAISRQLAMLMGGTLGVTSAEGEGSCFWLRLPLVPVAGVPRREVAQELVPFARLLGHRPHVLLAEDVPANQLIAKHMVAGFGCDVEVVTNGAEAIKALEVQPYDLVLMDVSMPTMDGLEATRLIRARDDQLAQIPIVGVTAYAAREDTERFVAAGMNRCVVKPLDRQELYLAMKAVLVPHAAAPVDAPEKVTETEEILVDPAVLGELRKHLEPSQIDKLLGKFDEDLRRVTAEACKALAADDANMLAQAMHAIKGLAGSLGAQLLASRAQELETLARAGNIAVVQTMEQTFRALVTDTLEHFSVICSERGS